MAFADSSETEIAFIPESTFGTTPATPAFQRMRVTSEDLTGEQQTVVSNELRPDAEVADLIRVGESATGNLPFELSFGAEFDTLFEHALRGTFSGNDLKGGTEKKSMTIEKRHETGATDHYFRYVGCRVGSFSLNLRAQEIVTGAIQVQGLNEATDTAIIAGATYQDANANAVMAAPDVGVITVGGVAGSLFYTDLSFSLTNNLRAQACHRPGGGGRHRLWPARDHRHHHRILRGRRSLRGGGSEQRLKPVLSDHRRHQHLHRDPAAAEVHLAPGGGRRQQSGHPGGVPVPSAL